MSPTFILLLILGYFLLLIAVSRLVGRGGNDSFFRGNRASPWYVVAFGMIGASLSGVTFISVPGWVQGGAWSYMQVVFGYIVGYMVIGQVLLPLYYRLNLTSIYTYLDGRFGPAAYKTGSSFFILSRIIGASFRLFLVANVMQLVIFDPMDIGVEFWHTVVLTILLIWIYTYRSGIQAIVWTDTLQTLFMLIAVGVAVVAVGGLLDTGGIGVWDYIAESDMSQIFFFEDSSSGDYFWKQFLSGAFIAIVMTGLDQDMMQKNLTCRNLRDAQKNMFWFTIVLTFVNVVFLALGVLLTGYAAQQGINASKDDLFPILATSGELGLAVGVFFILGLIAAAYSSADSALTSLTTSFSVDILEVENRNAEQAVATRKWVHVAMSITLAAVIIGFKYLTDDDSIIKKVFTFAGYTYGPLLGLYAYGLLTNLRSWDKFIPIICVLSPILTILLDRYLIASFDYELGFAVLIVNGCMTFVGLLLAGIAKSNMADEAITK